MTAIKYMQIFEDLKEKIEMGVLEPGDILPSENTLSNHYGVSRMSARKSLLLLSEKGYIYSAPGKGYFVSEPSYSKHTLYFDETDFIKRHVDQVKLHGVDIIPAPDEVADKLKITKGKKVICVKNLFYAEDVPIAYDVKYLPYDKGKPYVEEEIGYATFPEIITNQVSLFSVRKEIRIWPELSNEEKNKLFRYKESKPFLVIEQKCVNLEGKPMALGYLYIIKEYSTLYAVSSL